jgi:PAS domain S-box-containing protein
VAGCKDQCPGQSGELGQWATAQDAALEAVLTEREGLYRTLAANIPNVTLMMFDHDLRYTLVEGSFWERHGYSKVSIEGKTIWEAFPQQQAQAYVPLYRAVLAGQKFSHELERDGHFYEVHLVPITNEQGEVSAGLVVTTDITQRKQAEADLQRHAVELEQRVAERTAELQASLDQEKQIHELKARFGSMVTHEFRNPLAAIQLSADVLRKFNHKLDDDKRLEHVERILARVKFLSGLLDDILTISKAETVGLDFSPAPLDLEALCRDIIEEIQPGSGPQVLFSASGSHMITGDEKLLHQMISNLLSNAIKYSPNSGVVQVDLYGENDSTVLHISDQGIGIPEDDQKRLFETFHRGRNAAGIPGTGLGLAIAHRAAEAHGGTIAVESDEGIGTTFIVRLPGEGRESAAQA